MANMGGAHPYVDKEHNTQRQGRGKDTATKQKKGPAAGGGGSNPTKSGGINRATKGR